MYKRQVYGSVPNIFICYLICSNIGINKYLFCTIPYIAVSYTHLDVYKRQIGDGTEKVLINPDIGANEITDENIGNRTIDQGIAATVSNTGTLTQLFSFLAKVIKSITGKTNWYDAPVKTIAALNTDISNHAGNSSVHVTTQDKANWSDKYTKNEIDNKFSTLETNIDWKESVDTYASIATTYPNPQDLSLIHI